MSRRRGKKRGKSEPAAPVRSSRTRTIIQPLAFDFTTPSPATTIGVSAIHASDDRISYEIRFAPPLEKIYASSSTLSILHIPSKRRDTRITILPHTKNKKRYFEFVTHVVKMDEPVSCVEILYLTLENHQMRGDNPTPIWLPTFNLSFFHERYHALDFFPPDTQGPVDLSIIPQGSPVKHKPSGGITSSRVPKLLGYYPGKDVFTPWKMATMRFGIQSEAKAALMYLNKHKDRTFTQVGFISSEHAGPLDGAMCDGMVREPGEARFPIEFKSSRNNCNFDGTHMAQCIWEMGCGFPHIDLVRYCERQVKNADGKWETGYECREVRLFRCLETEKTIIKLVKNANKADPALFASPPYVEMRAILDTLAKEANASASDIPVDTALLAQLEEFKQNSLAEQNADNATTHPLMERIEERQARIFAQFDEGGGVDFVREIAAQIQDYSEFIKTPGSL